MDLEYIESLAELVSRTQVTEVTVRRGTRTVTVRRRADGVIVSAPPAEPVDRSTAIRAAPAAGGMQLPAMLPVGEALVAVGATAAPAARRFEIVRAHRVGRFHRSAAPDGEPLIEVGVWGAAQQQLGSIESMGVFDEIDSPVSGSVVGVFVAEGAAVEYGQPLFHLELGDMPSNGRGRELEDEETP